MRISDWSSDVCSSDLLPGIGKKRGPQGRVTDGRTPLEPNGNIGEARIERSDVVHRTLRLQGQICDARCKDIRRRGGDEAVRSEGCRKIGREIGRASSRERGGKYV